jgi:hypothetical protein
MPLSVTITAPTRPSLEPDTTIRTVVNHGAYSLGDVIVLKHQYLTPKGSLLTVCSRCGLLFPTTFRRMKRGRCEVRNVPQCSPCRSRYHTPKEGTR